MEKSGKIFEREVELNEGSEAEFNEGITSGIGGSYVILSYIGFIVDIESFC